MFRAAAVTCDNITGHVEINGAQLLNKKTGRRFHNIPSRRSSAMALTRTSAIIFVQVAIPKANRPLYARKRLSTATRRIHKIARLLLFTKQIYYYNIVRVMKTMFVISPCSIPTTVCHSLTIIFFFRPECS